MKKLARSVSFGVLLSILAGGAPTSAHGAEPGGKTPGVEISVDNFTFGTAEIAVPMNATVTWVNHDDVPHVIASTDELFRSKALDTDDKFSFTFSKPGTYSYFCAFHPKMVGKVIVRQQ